MGLTPSDAGAYFVFEVANGTYQYIGLGGHIENLKSVTSDVP